MLIDFAVRDFDPRTVAHRRNVVRRIFEPKREELRMLEQLNHQRHGKDAVGGRIEKYTQNLRR